MVTGPQPDGYCAYAADAIQQAVGLFNITIAQRVQTLPNAVTVPQFAFDSIRASGRGNQHDHFANVAYKSVAASLDNVLLRY